VHSTKGNKQTLGVDLSYVPGRGEARTSPAIRGETVDGFAGPEKKKGKERGVRPSDGVQGEREQSSCACGFLLDGRQRGGEEGRCFPEREGEEGGLLDPFSPSGEKGEGDGDAEYTPAK